VPNSESAKKRVRQNAKRQSLNKWRKRRIKDSTRSFTEALQAQDVNKAEDAFRTTCGLLDRIACTSTMHRNTAARRKSRLARRLNALKQTKS
jgi:small subunit ribosomal protein S20